MAPHHQVKRPCSVFLPLRVWCYSICSTCSKFQSGDLLWSFLSKCLQGGALFIAREEKGLARFLLVLHDSSELPDAFGKRGIVSLPFILVLVAEIGCGECVNSRNELRLMPVGALAQETWLHFVAHLRRGRAAKGDAPVGRCCGSCWSSPICLWLPSLHGWWCMTSTGTISQEGIGFWAGNNLGFLFVLIWYCFGFPKC